MKDTDFIFTNEQYTKLQYEYQRLLTPNQSSIISTLNSIIRALQHNSFQMPTNLQREVLQTLSNAQQILSIVYQSKISPSPQFINNPYSLIYHLTNMAIELTSISLKCPYQIIMLKANSLVLQSIQSICSCFLDKNAKIFRF